MPYYCCPINSLRFIGSHAGRSTLCSCVTFHLHLVFWFYKQRPIDDLWLCTWADAWAWYPSSAPQLAYIFPFFVMLACVIFNITHASWKLSVIFSAVHSSTQVCQWPGVFWRLVRLSPSRWQHVFKFFPDVTHWVTWQRVCYLVNGQVSYVNCWVGTKISILVSYSFLKTFRTVILWTVQFDFLVDSAAR